MKSPLRYPGGKTRAVKTLMEFIPDDCGELCSPFLGGGSVELALAEKGITVHGYDGFKPIVWFWHALLFDPEHLALLIERMRKRKHYKRPRTKPLPDGTPQKIYAKGLPKKDFLKFREEIKYALRSNYGFSYELAAKVYALNRSSFSGGTLTGGFSEEASWARFTDQLIDQVRNFKIENLTVKHADFKNSMKKHDCLFYLDPPYFLEGARSSLYGDEGGMHEYFPHLALFSALRERENWILSYNDCAEIRHLYRDYIIHEASWTYGMNKSKKSSEIIITNLPKRMHCVTIDLKGETNGEKSQDEN